METAEAFARRMHAGQVYEGHGDYADTHLRAVVQVLSDFALECQWADAGWLHDVIEDTQTTREELERLFGWEVALLVWACTKEGITKAERAASIYKKIWYVPPAAKVKIADRIANIEARPSARLLEKYRAEMPAFAEYIRPHVPRKMWERLTDALATVSASAPADAVTGQGDKLP